MTKAKKYLVPLLTVLSAPVAIMIIILLAYKQDGAYPFGEGTVAWCDMVQQVVPLLIDFKDILAGKDGVFLNFHNAAGMNMWAVIFFFMASPFSFLAAFVEKTDMLHFANILVMLKLMLCGGTAAFYLRKNYKTLDNIWVGALGTLYGLSGYGMLYYQNIIWLDMMYLFPLLLLSLEALCDKKSVLPYTAVLAAMMTVNYYIGYMVVIFIMLFIALALMSVRKEKTGGDIAVRFVIGSAMAAMLTAVVWLPSLLQYTKSGRVKEEFFSSVKTAGFLTNYETVLPTVLCSAFVLAAVAVFSSDGRKRSRRLNNYLLLTVLTLIPLIVEPINLMWHTGNYMSFPSRFGFITEFMLVTCTAAFLEDKEGFRKPDECRHTDNYFLLAALLFVIYIASQKMMDYLAAHRDKAGEYAKTLWGNGGSLQVCVMFFAVGAALSSLMIVLYKKGLLSRLMLGVLCAALIACEAYNNTRIYLTTPVYSYPERAADQNKVYDLADRLPDTDMFRVKTDGKLFYVNLVGTLGYGSISHYTSLNSQDYMFMMKRYGYSSNWMDVGSYGGTELTDLLMSIKYRIVRGSAEDAVYSNGDYSIVPMEEWLSSGLVLDSMDYCELDDVTRGEVQKILYDHTLAQYGGADAVALYEFDGTQYAGGYKVTAGESYVLELDIKGRQSVYFDGFDKPVVALGTDIDKSFDVLVNGNMIKSEYPNGDFNGLLKLGEFENEKITVTVNAKRDLTLRSMGAMTIDLDKLYAAAENAQTVDFAQKGGKLSGTVSAKAGQKCLINVPYTDGIRVKINGRNVPCEMALGGLTAVELQDGENSITVTATAKGFGAGLVISLAGLALCAAWHLFGKKLKIAEKPAKAVMWAVTAAGGAVFIAVYVLPVWLNLTYKE